MMRAAYLVYTKHSRVSTNYQTSFASSEFTFKNQPTQIKNANVGRKDDLSVEYVSLAISLSWLVGKNMHPAK